MVGSAVEFNWSKINVVVDVAWVENVVVGSTAFIIDGCWSVGTCWIGNFESETTVDPFTKW